jgi:penicillin-binding protein 2
VTALAGLEEGEIYQNTTVLDEGSIKVGEAEFRSWFYWNYGKTEGLLNLRKAISRSNDIYFYKVAEWVGVDNLAKMAKVFGFGEYTQLEIGPEAKGLVPTPEWKEQVIGEKWYLGNTYHMGIGQGDVLASPLQVNGLIGSIANEGVWCQPRLVGDTQVNCRGLGIKPENLNLVLSGMIDACSSGGTAFPFFERNSIINTENNSNDSTELINKGAVACKTGTAEFGAANEEGFRPTHGWFVAYLKPRSNKENFPSKIVITVLIESDDDDSSKEGSYDAAPVAKEIIDYIESR